MPNRLLPVYFKLEGQRVLVVGGGRAALGRVRLALEAGARVRLVSPVLEVPELVELAGSGELEWLCREFLPEDLDDVVLVFAATPSTAGRHRVHAEAERRRLPVNVEDVPELCRFYMPATWTDGHLKLAVSTNGRSPAFAVQVRDELARSLGPEYAQLLEILDRLRPLVFERFSESFEDRRRFFRRAASERNLARIRAGEREAVWRELEDALEESRVAE